MPRPFIRRPPLSCAHSYANGARHGRGGGRGGGGGGRYNDRNRGFDDFPGGLPGMGAPVAPGGAGYQGEGEYVSPYGSQDRY